LSDQGRVKAVYAGTFDPFTMGHLDVARRASRLFSELVVGVSEDSGKCPVFTLDERVEMVGEACANLGNVRAVGFKGLVVDFAREVGARVIVKGLRAVSDFEREVQMALMNRRLEPEVDTVLVVTDTEYMFLSSSLVKEVCSLGGEIGGYVPPTVLPRLLDRLRRGRDTE
jgi:pantetheine-phosphate adenylyltransferase